MFDVGQCATAVPAAPSRAISASLEMDAVSEPGPAGQPAHAVQVVDRAQAEHLAAEVLLVEGLGEVRVQPDVMPLGHRGALGA